MNTSKPLCKNKQCYCEKQECQYMNKQYGLSKWVFLLILLTILIGLIFPFGAEVVLPFFLKDEIVINHLSVWNQYVSIILGIIATILSIVSIIMGFKNYDDTLRLQKESTVALEKIKDMSVTVNTMSNELNKNSAKIDNMTSHQKNEPWEA